MNKWNANKKTFCKSTKRYQNNSAYPPIPGVLIKHVQNINKRKTINDNNNNFNNDHHRHHHHQDRLLPQFCSHGAELLPNSVCCGYPDLNLEHGPFLCT